MDLAFGSVLEGVERLHQRIAEAVSVFSGLASQEPVRASEYERAVLHLIFVPPRQNRLRPATGRPEGNADSSPWSACDEVGRYGGSERCHRRIGMPTARLDGVRRSWARDLRVSIGVIVALVAAGIPAGMIWWAWSPRTVGYVFAPHAVIPDDSEALIASDGRFLVITAAVGLLAAVLVWSRRSWRGPLVAAGLGVGALAGALVTDLIGRLAGGGHTDGPLHTLIKLPVAVRAEGLLLVQPLVALLVYGLAVSFASHDDLGRPALVSETTPTDLAEAGSPVVAGTNPAGQNS